MRHLLLSVLSAMLILSCSSGGGSADTAQPNDTVLADADAANLDTGAETPAPDAAADSNADQTLADVPLLEDSSDPDSSPLDVGDLTPGAFHGNIVLGAPSATSIHAMVYSPDQSGTVWLVYGTAPGVYVRKTPESMLKAGETLELTVEGLAGDTRYYYRLFYESGSGTGSGPTEEYTFHTARASGSTFSFGIQGDSHPERAGNMYSADLYTLNMQNAAKRQLDFYFGLGDDFSIERLIQKGPLTQASVDAVYQNQQGFFGILGHSTPIFLVNGNHEQAAGYLLTDAYPTPYADAPIFAGKARVSHFALPVPDSFYTGDTEEVEGVGLLQDYYAWEWGDALFVTIDPYWHSPVPVDTGVPGVDKVTDQWLPTMGDAQYAWLKKTLEGSKAKYKFVFEHHLLGNGRGAAGMAHQFEWGGYNAKGTKNEFATKRPTWAKPIHQLMVDTKVTIFFFGHDHIYAREKVDTVVYQSVPNPADNTYTDWNVDAYDPATITFPGAVYDPDYGVTLPDSGFLNVTVSPEEVTVSYIRAVLPGDEAKAGCANDFEAFTYSVTAD